MGSALTTSTPPPILDESDVCNESLSFALSNKSQVPPAKSVKSSSSSKKGRTSEKSIYSLGSRLLRTIYSVPSIPIDLKELSPLTFEIANFSWFSIQSRTLPHISGTHDFILKLFENLNALDPSHAVSEIFHKSKKFYLVVNIINYLLAVPPDKSFRAKSKLRALGRAHARIRVLEKELNIFFEAFIRTIISIQSEEAVDVINAWRLILYHVIEQMTFEKVYFVDHHNANLTQRMMSFPPRDKMLASDMGGCFEGIGANTRDGSSSTYKEEGGSGEGGGGGGGASAPLRANHQ